jgi:uncharacterized RDD family membrane protein YckC
MTVTAALPPAPFWRRYAAWSLDFALLGVLAAALAWPHLVAGWQQAALALRDLSRLLGHALTDSLAQAAAPAVLAQQLLADDRVRSAAALVQSGIDQAAVWWLAAYAVLAALYHIGFERSAWRGSPGKHVLQLHVTGLRSEPISPARTVVRHVAGALSWLSLNLGHAWAAVPPQKRALHDYIAGARVLDGSGESRLPAWARLWLLAQVAAGVALTIWGMQRAVAGLQRSLS